jgi:hypothetical protein
MAKLFNGSIDLSKIDKSLIKTLDKDGNPFKNGAKYLNVSIWLNDEPDKFGNTLSIQIGDKENRIYLGNAKEYQKKQDTPIVTRADESDDLPF